MCPLPPEPPLPSPRPPRPPAISPGCHRARGLGSLHRTPESHWLSVLHTVMYMFQCCSLKASHLSFPRCVLKSVFYVCEGQQTMMSC